MTGGERGQASVELVALVPLVAIVVLAASQWLAAGSARELAQHAAEAGAVAVAERDADPAQAARDAVPGADRGRLAVTVHGRRVSVTLEPASALPGLGPLLRARAAAVAGAAP